MGMRYEWAILLPSRAHIASRPVVRSNDASFTIGSAPDIVPVGNPPSAHPLIFIYGIFESYTDVTPCVPQDSPLLYACFTAFSLPLGGGCAKLMVSGRYDTEGDVLSVAAREMEWLSLKDVQQLLGIGRTKSYELVATGELPAVRIGRCIRVHRTELDEWLRTQRYVDSIKHDIV